MVRCPGPRGALPECSHCRGDREGHHRAAGGPKKAALASWLATLRSTYAERVLPIDATIATIWGRLTALVERRGGLLGVVDGLIAATALHHGYTVVTRNIADFAGTGVPVINVWER